MDEESLVILSLKKLTKELARAEGDSKAGRIFCSLRERRQFIVCHKFLG